MKSKHAEATVSPIPTPFDFMNINVICYLVLRSPFQDYLKFKDTKPVTRIFHNANPDCDWGEKYMELQLNIQTLRCIWKPLIGKNVPLVEKVVTED